MAKISINLKSGTLEEPGLVVGIDLGTTNSLVARVNPDTGKPEVLGQEGDVIVPSVVHLTPEGMPIVGRVAREALLSKPETTIFSVKRLLGRSYEDVRDHAAYYTYRIIDEKNDQLVRVEAHGRYYTPVELSAQILSELKRRAEKYTGRKVDKAVITVPAYFNDNQRQATRDAGKLAGLDVLRIVNEPTAASLAYGIGMSEDELKTILVYDLGGGTFDVSVLRIENGVFEVLSTHGDTYLGGDDFDRAVVQHWCQSAGFAFENLNITAQQALRLTAEQAKIKVCSGGRDFHAQVNIGSEDLTVMLTEALFNELTAGLLDRTMKAVRRALADAGLTPEAIDEVVLVGGSTRIPAVRQRLAGIFGQIKVNDRLNPDEVVALGAAIEADILAGNRRDILLLDVTPLSLGIETLGGLMDVIIPRNSRIPTRAGRQYTTSVDGQVNMMISVYQGERELTAENRKLAEFELRGIPAMPAGLPKVEVNFMLNADGILTVEATELRSGVHQQVAVKPQYGLTDEQVENMLMDSLMNAREDVARRMIVEARTEAEQLIYTVERFITKNGDMLDQDEMIETGRLMGELRTLLGSEDKDAILAGIDRLNEYTRPFAERLMDQAVAKALKGTSIDQS